ncbi:cora-domain-containing protein [Xylariomycetidae sp. FL2044]|nr:cora-domain-containing protein [Xylariomycetidae sp. FL2044]
MASNPFSPLDPIRTSAEPSTSSPNPPPSGSQTPKKKHRAGRKHKRPRQKSFAPSPGGIAGEGLPQSGQMSTGEAAFYSHGSNLSNTSLESEALLDHREHHYTRPRRPSNLANSLQMPSLSASRFRTVHTIQTDDDDEDRNHESAPLLSSSGRLDSASGAGYGSNDGKHGHDKSRSRHGSRASSRRPRMGPPTPSERHNVNYPPSRPGTPPWRPADRMDMGFGDVMIRDELTTGLSRSNSMLEPESDPLLNQASASLERRHTIAMKAEEDVCFPQDAMSEIAEEDVQNRDSRGLRSRRRWRNKWPDLTILEEWSSLEKLEKEGPSPERRLKRITEPQLVNGRLRPIHKGWYRAEEDAPFRFTYFNEEFESTIHSQTISELAQSGASFRELFIPDLPLLSDSSEDDNDEEPPVKLSGGKNSEVASKGATRQSSMAQSLAPVSQNPEAQADATLSPKPQPQPEHTAASSRNHSGDATPMRSRSPFPGMKSPPPNGEKKPLYGERPVWWLDVLSPTEEEMKVLSKAFGIHPLTAEDIMLQEQREKVELFRHYYFVNYRSFDQDTDSDNHLEPVNMYVVVFREGIISFHWSQTPHPANVRRRIRQLKDFMVLSADWISYAIIDDITDVYLPLIQTIEDEVDDIDDRILQLHSSSDPDSSSSNDLGRDNGNEKSNPGDASAESGGDMLRRVGDCRKKVMSLYRLLGNKADVIKGFAKRCNEHWEVAPRSEIGLYLGDIQDHIVTMTANLSHYEMILARCHANYIAQINIRMNERQEQTADVLGKLTVLGTIVLPMNIITGLWGMNVWVPGQEYEGNLNWFFAITGGLIVFGVACFWIAKRVYGIV